MKRMPLSFIKQTRCALFITSFGRLKTDYDSGESITLRENVRRDCYHTRDTVTSEKATGGGVFPFTCRFSFASYNCLLIVAASAASATWGCARASARLSLARLKRRRRLRRLCALRNNPDFKLVRLAVTTVNDRDSIRIDAARPDHVVSGTIAQALRLTGAAGASRIDDDIAGRAWLVRKLYRQVVQTRLLIIESQIREFVEGARPGHGRRRKDDRRDGLRRLSALRNAGAVVNDEDGGDAAIAHAGRVHCDGGRARAADDSGRSRAHRPCIVERRSAAVADIRSEGDHVAVVDLTRSRDAQVGRARLRDDVLREIEAEAMTLAALDDDRLRETLGRRKDDFDQVAPDRQINGARFRDIALRRSHAVVPAINEKRIRGGRSRDRHPSVVLGPFLLLGGGLCLRREAGKQKYESDNIFDIYSTHLYLLPLMFAAAAS